MIQKFLISGGTPLSGKVEISGYKNSAGRFCLRPACFAFSRTSEIDNLPW